MKLVARAVTRERLAVFEPRPQSHKTAGALIQHERKFLRGHAGRVFRIMSPLLTTPFAIRSATSLSRSELIKLDKDGNIRDWRFPHAPRPCSRLSGRLMAR